MATSFQPESFLNKALKMASSHESTIPAKILAARKTEQLDIKLLYGLYALENEK